MYVLVIIKDKIRRQINILFTDATNGKNVLLRFLKSQKPQKQLLKFIKSNLESKLDLEWMKIDALNALNGELDSDFVEILNKGQKTIGLDFSCFLSEIILLEVERISSCMDLDQCLAWFTRILPCLDLFFQNSIEWKNRMEFHMYKSICLCRINSVFELVTDYPHSIDLINDLKVF